MIVASTRMASVSPTPNIRMNDTLAAANAAKEIDMMTAAAVMTRSRSCQTQCHAFVVGRGRSVGGQPYSGSATRGTP